MDRKEEEGGEERTGKDREGREEEESKKKRIVLSSLHFGTSAKESNRPASHISCSEKAVKVNASFAVFIRFEYLPSSTRVNTHHRSYAYITRYIHPLRPVDPQT